MNVTQWLEARFPAFGELSEDERLAILGFALLWSLFEANVLDMQGNAQRIIDAVGGWIDHGLLVEDTFQDDLAYFRNRYVGKNGAFTHHHAHLNLRAADQPDLVNRVLRSETADLGDLTAGVLIIVYRYRNNLFHGEKWAYQLQGQLDNFTHANSILMKAMELHVDQ